MNTVSYDDMDYIVYLDKNRLPLAYHLTQDEITAIELKYELKVDTDFDPPEGTTEVLSVLGIHTSLWWKTEVTGTSTKNKNELLFYKPDYMTLAKEIACELDTSMALDDFLKDNHAETTKKTCRFLNADGTCFICYKTPCPPRCEGRERSRLEG